MKLKTPALRISLSKFDLEPVSYNYLEQGNIIRCNYNGYEVNDHSPLIYVLEKRQERIYGLNLHYYPRLFTEIMKYKNSLLEKELKRQETDVRKLLLESDKQGTLEKIKEARKKLHEGYYDYFPEDSLDFFPLPPGFRPYGPDEILRNYLKNFITNIKLVNLRVTAQ